MEKYPVYTLSVNKNETTLKSVDEIISHFKTKIDEHDIAKYIATFDHYSHTKSLDGEINKEIKNAKNIIFCFGAAIPNTKILAVRPRSVGVAELEESFAIEFMEAPIDKLTKLMESWTKEIITK